MPRKYIRKTNKASWTSESLNAALDAIKEGVPLREASRRFKIPRASSSRPSAASQEDLEAAASTSAEPQIIPASDEDTEAVANTNRQFQITAAREKAHLNLAKQAQRMKLASDSIHARVEIGDNIIIPIPDVDRAKADLRNIIGVVLQMDEQGLHKIGTKYGILDKLYCSDELHVQAVTENVGFARKRPPCTPAKGFGPQYLVNECVNQI
ncbi:hypothetical protein MML48_2g00021012 [Holotrichia oblita]|uniref:Uncharacterized protein n=1 Tax=Holotrichia oblita TaxID=644536 RepID=A0ACB9TM81_HOLOL|nr:hypothetical protein MML48_2g00021012 [Holotrichia oblita]